MTRIARGAVPPPQQARTEIPPSAVSTVAPPSSVSTVAPSSSASTTVPELLVDSMRSTDPPSSTTTLRAATLPTGRFPTTSHDERIGTHLQGLDELKGPSAEAPKLRLVAGKVVPGTRYRIIRWLGEGGMGVVYEAEQVDIERRVALKILRFDLSRQPRMVQVFKDEARAASRLGSQYVVEIYDFGELADGRMFFAMELLDGHDLVPAADEDGMDPARLLGLLRQLCKGLGRAHAAGVVHRDVKPENLITATAIDGRETVKMVDFGISAMLAEGRDGSGIAGTPHYMPPEQILGQTFDGRLDIYALGCTAYELLVGVPPFDAETVPALLRMQLEDAPEWPRMRFPERKIPAALEAVIMRCLAKDPGGRYPNTAELEAALCEAQIADGLVTAWDDLPLPDIADVERREWIRRNMPTAIVIRERHRWLWPVVAGVSTLAAAGLGLFLVFGRGPTVEEQDVVEVLTNEARAAAVKAHWVMAPKGAPTALTKVQDIEALEGAAEQYADARGVDLRREFADTLVRHGNELWDYGAVPLAAQRYLDALAFDENDPVATERLATIVPAASIADYITRARRGELNEVEQALSLIATAEMSDNPDEREALVAIIDDMMATSAMPETTKVLLAGSVESKSKVMQQRKRRARETAPKVDPPVRVAVAESPVAAAPAGGAPTIPPPPPVVRAEAASKTTRATSARPASEQEAIVKASVRDPERAKTLAAEGHAKLRAGQRHEAESLFHQAVSADPSNSDALIGLSDVYFDTGETHKAVSFAQRAVQAAPKNRTLRLKLGDCYFKVLRYDDALAQYEEAKQLGDPKAEERIQRVRSKLGH